MSLPPRTRVRVLRAVALSGLTALTVAGSPGVAVAATSADPVPSGAFVEDFDGASGALAAPTTWTYQTGGNWSGGQELQQYTDRAENAHLTGNGSLLITARGETYTGKDKITRNYTSARLTTKRAFGYGTMSARIRMSAAKGSWPAFWTLGSNYAQVGWPTCGEIDVMESTNNDTVLYNSIHGPVQGGTKYQTYNAGKGTLVAGGLALAWHVYSAEWTPDAVTFLLDGVPTVTVNRKELPPTNIWALDGTQNLILDVAVGGMAGTPAAPADFRSTMEVDWVKVVPMSAAPTAPSTSAASSTVAASSLVAPSSSPAASSSITTTTAPPTSSSAPTLAATTRTTATTSPAATSLAVPTPGATASPAPVQALGVTASNLRLVGSAGQRTMTVDLTVTSRAQVVAVLASSSLNARLLDLTLEPGVHSFVRLVPAWMPANRRAQVLLIVTDASGTRRHVSVMLPLPSVG